MTGLTRVLLMGAALYVSFQGQATFSTAYEALQILTNGRIRTATDLSSRPTAPARHQTNPRPKSSRRRSRKTIDGQDMIKKQPFERIRATLATVATSLSDDVPAYDPGSLIEPPNRSWRRRRQYGDLRRREVEGEVPIKTGACRRRWRRPSHHRPGGEADVRQTLETYFSEGGDDASERQGDTGPRLAPDSTDALRDLGAVNNGSWRRRRKRHRNAQDPQRRQSQPGPHRTYPRHSQDRPSSRTMLLKNGFTSR